MSVDFTVYDARTGQRLRGGHVASIESAQQQARDGEAVYLGSMKPTQYMKDGVLLDMPLRPSAGHAWDWSTHSWVEDLAGARQAARQRIEAERLVRTVQPIDYDGLALDADPTAQANVSAKLQEIAQCRALGVDMPAELLVWRDADNVTHTFDSLDAYATWLGGLAIAITRRGTEAYAWAWAQKRAVDTATALADIQAIPSTETTTTTPESTE